MTNTADLNVATPHHPRRRALRGAGAVLGGFFAVFALSTVTDIVLHATGVFPPWGQAMSDGLFLLATAYRVVYTVAGGYITARLAPERPMAHVLVLGGIGLAVSLVAVVLTWDLGPEFGPRWYPLALVVTSLPSVWAGGKLFDVRAHAGTAPGMPAA
jgi:hypothetical protein